MTTRLESAQRHDFGEMQGAPVRVVNLIKKFDSFCAVDDVSIEVQPGEFLSLLGPSGSGKTTILMSIAGFEQPTGGDIFINEHSVTQVPPNRRNIGMVFQKYALFPHMTVFQNVAFPLKRRKIRKAEVRQRVAEALEMVRLGSYADRKPGQLSGGQQQRVALARATVYRPPLLLMDEPLGALDKKLREQVQLEIKHLQRRLGTTVIYVTHDQDEALTMSDRVAVLNRGKLEQIGSPEDLYERPINGFVADFVGEANFLSGTLRSREGEACTVELGGGTVVDARLTQGGADPRLGAGVRVAVRPQRVRLGDPGAAGTSGPLGTVIETVYSGDSLAFIVQLERGTRITARADTSGQLRWRTGDKIEVAWKPEDARVYEEVDTP